MGILHSLIREDLTYKEFEFTNDQGGRGRIRLDPHGKIGIHNHENERTWKVKNGKLIFFNSEGKPTTAFKIESDGSYTGTHNSGTIQRLREIHKVKTKKYWRIFWGLLVLLICFTVTFFILRITFAHV